jgi:hypothetical protein
VDRAVAAQEAADAPAGEMIAECRPAQTTLIILESAVGHGVTGKSQLAKSDNEDLACWDFSGNHAAVYRSPNE